MLTLFTIPKAFRGHAGMIQENAFRSWSRLAPDLEVIVFGGDEGVHAAAERHGFRHGGTLPLNPHGTPTLREAFERARGESARSWLMYSNADMVYDDSLFAAVRSAAAMPSFLLSGQRKDFKGLGAWRSPEDQFWADFFRGAQRQGRWHGPSGMDYFIFPRHLAWAMPNFAVGRVGWDSWMIWTCRSRRIPVIDATRTVLAIHQEHGYGDLPLGYQHEEGVERDLNLRAAGGPSHLLTLREANWHLVAGDLVRPPVRFWISAWFGGTRIYQLVLAWNRGLRTGRTRPASPLTLPQ